MPGKAFQLSAFIILLAMVAVQFNDPDTLFWITFYGVCALLPLTALLKLNNKVLFIICALFALYAMAISLGGVTEYSHHYQEESILQRMSADKLYLEETREFFGSLIALILISISQLITSKTNSQ